MKTVKLEVEDKEVEICVPEGAIVTTAIVMIEYQYIDEDGELRKGFSWSSNEGCDDLNLVGLVDLCQMNIKNNILKGWDEDGI